MKTFNYDNEYYSSGIGGFHAASFESICLKYNNQVQAITEIDNILDFGCGNGFYGYFLSSSAKKLDGVDFSGAILSSPSVVYYENFYQIDLGQPWIPLKTYDVVFSVEVIEHVENYQQFLDNACLALRPGGRLFLTTTSYSWSIFILLIVYRREVSWRSLTEFCVGLTGNKRARTNFVMRFWDYFTGHYHGFTKRQLKHALKKSGFILESIDFLHVQNMFPVAYLNQPYGGRYKFFVTLIIPILVTVGKAINWVCKKMDLNAPNIILVARKPDANDK